MRLRANPIGAVLISAFALAYACSPASPTVSRPTIQRIEIAGVVPLLGRSEQFTATAFISNGTTFDVSTLASWRSSNPASLDVSPTGRVGARQEGSSVLSAQYQGVTGSREFAVICKTTLFVGRDELAVGQSKIKWVSGQRSCDLPHVQPMLATWRNLNPDVVDVRTPWDSGRSDNVTITGRSVGVATVLVAAHEAEVAIQITVYPPAILRSARLP
jgi:hypothetical protein